MVLHPGVLLHFFVVLPAVFFTTCSPAIGTRTAPCSSSSFPEPSRCRFLQDAALSSRIGNLGLSAWAIPVPRHHDLPENGQFINDMFHHIIACFSASGSEFGSFHCRHPDHRLVRATGLT
jgi:hypothetical protein